MNRILIADDEGFERDVLKFLITENSFPLEVVEAENGQEAWNIIETERIDILLTDVKMPFLDGIKLVEMVRAKYPQIYVIFFSGYVDFRYVKEALRMNVTNYILKPINPDEFCSTLSDIMEEISKREERRAAEKKEKRIIRDYVLHQILSGKKPEEVMEQNPTVHADFLKTLHILCVLQLEIRTGYEFLAQNTEQILEKITDELPDNCYATQLFSGEIVLVFFGESAPNMWYSSIIQRVQKRIKSDYSLECVASSEHISGAESLSAAYNSIRQRISERFFCMDGKESEQSSVYTTKNAEEFSSLEYELSEAIQCRDRDLIRQTMGRVIALFRRSSGLSHLLFFYLVTGVLKTIYSAIPEPNSNEFEKYVEKVYNAVNFAEIEGLLLDITKQILDGMDEAEPTARVINRVKKYINQHYMDDLSLDILADHCYLTPQYLSAVFIENNDCGINKYIKKVRMRKAQELLSTTNMKISDVGAKVGYMNMSYFSKCFMEECGISPKAYREIHSKP